MKSLSIAVERDRPRVQLLRLELFDCAAYPKALCTIPKHRVDRYVFEEVNVNLAVSVRALESMLSTLILVISLYSGQPSLRRQENWVTTSFPIFARRMDHTVDLLNGLLERCDRVNLVPQIDGVVHTIRLHIMLEDQTDGPRV